MSDSLNQELSQRLQEALATSRGDGQQRVIAPLARVVVAARSLL